jgi:DNA replication protein DnaC
MNIVELRHGLSTLRLGGIASALEARLIEAQSEKIAKLVLSTLVADELNRRSENFIARRIKQARFRDADKSLESFDFDFNNEDEPKATLRAGHRAIHQ